MHVASTAANDTFYPNYGRAGWAARYPGRGTGTPTSKWHPLRVAAQEPAPQLRKLGTVFKQGHDVVQG